MKPKAIIFYILLLSVSAVTVWSVGHTGGTAQVPQSATTPIPRASKKWMKKHNQINVLALRGNIDVAFLGDSITAGWKHAGRQVWEEYYGHRRAANMGISEDCTQHLLWRLANGNLKGISPRVAVLLIGTNNAELCSHTPAEIAEGVGAAIALLRKRMQPCRIIVMGIFPRDPQPTALRQVVLDANKLIRQFADEEFVFFLDIGDRFMQPEGGISSELMPDFLHLSSEGYKLWAESIEDLLAELLGEHPA